MYNEQPVIDTYTMYSKKRMYKRILENKLNEALNIIDNDKYSVLDEEYKSLLNNINLTLNIIVQLRADIDAYNKSKVVE